MINIPKATIQQVTNKYGSKYIELASKFLEKPHKLIGKKKLTLKELAETKTISQINIVINQNNSITIDLQSIKPAINEIYLALNKLYLLHPDEQINFIKNIEKILSINSSEEILAFNHIINIYFNWNSFISFMDVKKLLSHIYYDLNINNCPYCNRNYTSILKLSPNKEQASKFKYLKNEPIVKKKYILPSFDHYLPKSKYPYLALTLWNLIPTCEYCNSKLKHDKPTLIVNSNSFDCLHPYINGFAEGNNHKIRFELELPEDSPGALYSANTRNNLNADFYDKFEISFITNSKDNTFLKQTKESVRMLALSEVYNQIHKRDAIDTAVKAIKLNKAYKQSLTKILNSDNTDSTKLILLQNDISKDLEFIVYGHVNEQNNELIEPLSLLKSDIIHQFSSNSNNNTYDWLVTSTKG